MIYKVSQAKRTVAFLAAVLPVVFTYRLLAATINAASCSQPDVQAAISSAQTGDTVTIPAGTCTWTSGVTISGKGITVAGAGSGRIIATGVTATALAIGTGSKTLPVTSTHVDGTLAISAGQTLRLSELGFRANFMQGTVASYSAGTLVMNITSSGGACGTAGPANTMNSNCKRWLVSTMPSTVIINNSASVLFPVTESTVNHIDISGIKVASGSGAGNAFYLSGATNGKAIFLHDNWFEMGPNNGIAIDSDISRGMVWNTSFDASPWGTSSMLAFRLKGGPSNSFTTPSTMGMADSTGEKNFYLEDNDYEAAGDGIGDWDDNARVVFRYSFLNNSGGGTHGADTSNYGARHFEFYNNIGSFQGYGDNTTANMNWWLFVRGGTFVAHHNVLPALTSQDHGTKSDISMIVMNLQRNGGPNPCWGAGTSGGARYPGPRQVGMGYVTGAGHDGSGRTNDSITYVGDSEPAYIWANSRQPLTNVDVADYGGSGCTNPDTSANYLVLNRDYFNGSTAKPGYTPYTYPHPLRALAHGGTSPSPPTGLRVR